MKNSFILPLIFRISIIPSIQPLPEFNQTLAFYEQEWFALTSGRKMMALR
jgi:hypothetical protein